MNTATAEIQRFFSAKNPNIIVENQGVLEFNTGIWGSSADNAMPQFCVDLQSFSSVHQNLLALKESLILGNNVEIQDPAQPLAQELETFIARRNKSGDNLKSIYTKLSTDMALFEAAVLQVIYDRNGLISEVYHVPCEDFRLGAPNQYGSIDYGYISKNWAQISNRRYKKATAKNSAIKLRMLAPQEYKEHPVQLVYMKKYSPSTYYSVPDYLSSAAWIMIDWEISNFHLGNIRNSFFLSGMLTQQGNPSSDEKKEFIENFKSLYAGVSSPDSSKQSMLFSWVDDMNSAKPEFTPFQGEKNDDLFQNLVKTARESIIASHSAYEGLIFSDKGSDLGGDSNKYFTQLQLFNELVASKMKDVLLGGLDRVLSINGFPALAVITEPPKITIPETNVDDLTRDERRQIVYGLPPLTTDNDDNDINEDEIPEQ